jgi:Muconolactone delta-isomerase
MNNRTFMVEFELPEVLSETFISTIPRHRFMVNKMLAEGVIQAYSLALDRSRLWVIMRAESETALRGQIDRLPLAEYMRPHIAELMFHNTASAVMHFSLN